MHVHLFGHGHARQDIHYHTNLRKCPIQRGPQSKSWKSLGASSRCWTLPLALTSNGTGVATLEDLCLGT